MSSLHQHNDLFWNPAEKAPLLLADDVTDGSSTDTKGSPSRFERVITTYPPILESLLAQLPTLSILDLFHTSTHLRSFLCSYPLAWKTLSFRLPQPALTSVLGSPGNETPDGRDRQSKQYALDGLLIQVVVPFGTRLKNLDLCNTAVTGDSLTSRVLRPRISTIEHLSVRGCKNVSIKYQLLPFLEPYAQGLPWAPRGELALKSLYTYRCRHHRRRPYLPSSLVRRDSDSEPTHQLIEICHKLGIWTDTAWCPTPGGRCFRRKDYYAGRAALGSAEVWVPFDRLWRSGNRIGPGEDGTPIGRSKGTIWEDMETGHDGEALGTSDGPFFGEGKDVPAHLRQSHRLFVEDVKCDQCGDAIMERCEQCSIRMHCMGCRKTLCASCAFNRPIPRKRAKTRHFTSLAWGGSMHTGMESSTSSAAGSPAPQSRRPVRPKTNRFWWAPGATRSPNLMNETTQGDDSSDSEDGGHQPNATLPPFNQGPPPKLNTRWCCLEPIFSGGGGIAVLGPGVGGRGADRVRAAPLPKTKEFEDPDFNCPLKYVDPSREAHIRELKNHAFYGYHLGQEIDLVKYLTQDHLDLQATTCPRNLCQDCYRSFRWKVSCRKCMGAICKEHDFRALKVRRCGYRNLEIERDFIRNQPQQLEYYIPPFKIASSSSGTSTPTTEASSSLKAPSLVSNLGQSKPNASTHNLSLGQPSQESSPAKTWKSSSTPSSSRARSLSESGSSGRSPLSALVFNSYTHVSQRPITPGHPRHPVQWEGCGAYFCQASRPVGDCRMKCNAVIKECADCGVNVCEFCLPSTNPCPCAYCTSHYHCPPCAAKPRNAALCSRDAEQRAKKEAELREKEKRKEEAEALKWADELAGGVGEFFGLIVGGAPPPILVEESGNPSPLEELDTPTIPATEELHIPSNSADAAAALQALSLSGMLQPSALQSSASASDSSSHHIEHAEHASLEAIMTGSTNVPSSPFAAPDDGEGGTAWEEDPWSLVEEGASD